MNYKTVPMYMPVDIAGQSLLWEPTTRSLYRIERVGTLESTTLNLGVSYMKAEASETVTETPVRRPRGRRKIDTSSLKSEILNVLSETPMKRADILAGLGYDPQTLWYPAISELVSEGQVIKQGQRRATTYTKAA